jgi:thioredoxin reductase (NADPH)
LIPRTHNHAGYPEGISGKELLARMLAQAEKYGATRELAEVTGLRVIEEGFGVRVGEREYGARAVLLATGVVNHRPEMADKLHDEALQRGLLRYCPICDGYEVTDKRIAVIGTGGHGAREALFLRGYSADVTLIAPDAEHRIEEEHEGELDAAGIRRVDGPCGGYAIEGDRIAFDTAHGRMAFDTLYPALGSRIRSQLAVMAGARAAEDGCLEVDDHQRTSLPGLFAAGDVAKGLDQISHAMGEAGVAATTIRNMLAEQRPIRR